MEDFVLNKDYYGETTTMAKNGKKKHTVRKVVSILAIGASGLFLTAFFSVFGWMAVQVFEMKGISAENRTDINRILDRIDKLENSIEEINTGLNGNQDTKGIYTRLELIEERLNVMPISASNDMLSFINTVFIEPNDISITTTSITQETCVGTDANGNVYIADDLINKMVLLTYNENDKEVYFLGQYNENYRWNGFCVTNSYYSNGKLHGICESDFENGTRLNYKSIVYQPDDNDWLYSDRVCGENGNPGINMHYSFNYDKEKGFTSTNVRVSDIMYVDNFIENVDASITRYYSGNTLDAYLDDTSGSAYRATYYEDGTIKTLYVGNFVEGYFNDDSGDASYIDINEDELNEIISKYDFKCEIKWKK